MSPYCLSQYHASEPQLPDLDSQYCLPVDLAMTFFHCLGQLRVCPCDGPDSLGVITLKTESQLAILTPHTFSYQYPKSLQQQV